MHRPQALADGAVTDLVEIEVHGVNRAGYALFTEAGGAHNDANVAVAEPRDMLGELEHPVRIIDLHQGDVGVMRAFDANHGHAARNEPGDEPVEVFTTGEEDHGV